SGYAGRGGRPAAGSGRAGPDRGRRVDGVSRGGRGVGRRRGGRDRRRGGGGGRGAGPRRDGAGLAGRGVPGPRPAGLAAMEALGVAGDVAFRAPDAHQAEEGLALIPVLELLAFEVLREEVELGPDVLGAEGDVEVRRGEVAVVLGDLVLEDQVVAEGV